MCNFISHTLHHPSLFLSYRFNLPHESIFDYTASLDDNDASLGRGSEASLGKTLIIFQTPKVATLFKTALPLSSWGLSLWVS